MRGTTRASREHRVEGRGGESTRRYPARAGDDAAGAPATTPAAARVSHPPNIHFFLLGTLRLSLSHLRSPPWLVDVLVARRSPRLTPRRTRCRRAVRRDGCFAARRGRAPRGSRGRRRARTRRARRSSSGTRRGDADSARLPSPSPTSPRTRRAGSARTSRRTATPRARRRDPEPEPRRRPPGTGIRGAPRRGRPPPGRAPAPESTSGPARPTVAPPPPSARPSGPSPWSSSAPSEPRSGSARGSCARSTRTSTARRSFEAPPPRTPSSSRRLRATTCVSCETRAATRVRRVSGRANGVPAREHGFVRARARDHDWC